MPTTTVYFIDTTVFANIIDVPGKNSDHAAIVAEFDKRIAAGAKFVLPATTLIETGNFIAQLAANRRSAAIRFVKAIEEARSASPPWTVRDVSWGDRFLADLLNGDSTGSTLLDHLSTGHLGSGDVALLVERDQFRESTAFTDVRIWTLDARLAAYAG